VQGGATPGTPTPTRTATATATAGMPTATASATATPTRTPAAPDATPPAAPMVSSPSSSVITKDRAYAVTGTAEANALVRVWADANNNGMKDPGEALAGSQQLAGGATGYSVRVALKANADNSLVVTA